MISELIDLMIYGAPAGVDLGDGYTQKLIHRATLQHEVEYFCGCAPARVVGYRRDHRAIQEREQRLGSMPSVRPFRKRA